MKELKSETKAKASQTHTKAKSDFQKSARYEAQEMGYLTPEFQPPQRFTSLLGKLSHPTNATQRAQILTQLQQTYGNRYVQQVMALIGTERSADAEHVPTLAGPVPATKGAAGAKPTLTLGNNTYADTATESHKRIKFNVKVPSKAKATDYVLVNWVKGYAKDSSGNYYQATLYGSTKDINFSDFQVDSVDVDPVYWSQAGSRWNYNTTSTGFYATDDPGPARASEKGSAWALNFKIGLYKEKDVATTTSGTISATPIDTKLWQYSVVVDSKGKFTHPKI